MYVANTQCMLISLCHLISGDNYWQAIYVSLDESKQKHPQLVCMFCSHIGAMTWCSHTCTHNSSVHQFVYRFWNYGNGALWPQRFSAVLIGVGSRLTVWMFINAYLDLSRFSFNANTLKQKKTFVELRCKHVFQLLICNGKKDSGFSLQIKQLYVWTYCINYGNSETEGFKASRFHRLLCDLGHFTVEATQANTPTAHIFTPYSAQRTSTIPAEMY